MEDEINSTIKYMFYKSNNCYASINEDKKGNVIFNLNFHNGIPDVEWLQDIFSGTRYKYFKNIFNFQLKEKLNNYDGEIFNLADYGKILKVKFTSTLHHGYANSETNGFIDKHDLPPIDTWIDYTEIENDLTLFAIIPYDKIDPINEVIKMEVEGLLSWHN